MRYLVVLTLLLTGCATTAQFEEKLKTYVGLSEDEVVQRLGPPDNVYETSETRYLTYARSVSGYVPGVAPRYQTNVVGNTAYTTPVGGSPGYGYTNSCRVSFGLKSGRVAIYRYEGNGCRSR